MNVKKQTRVIKESVSKQRVSSDTTRVKDPLANIIETKPNTPSADVPTTRPKNPPANARPIEGYILEVDGKFKSDYESSPAAMRVGLELKKRYPQIQVKVYDAKERTRTAIELPG
jgi:hypothetical protein